MLRLGAERDELRIVDDQHGAPTAAAELARAAIHIAAAIDAGKQDGFGVFNFAGAGVTTWCGFARAIFAGAAARGSKAPLRVTPIATEDYPYRRCGRAIRGSIAPGLRLPTVSWPSRGRTRCPIASMN
jgi:dTDP-4-dehydrorhamnose reductase